jgi:hypothetical protein
MSELTEREIFDCLRTNLRSAAADCDLIARQPISGPIFDRMRKSLKLVEGACRQAAYWREDARWLPLGVKMEEVHQRARTWLHRPTVSSKKLFALLGDVLRKLLRDVDNLEFMATGRTGLILPKAQEPPLRQGRPVQVMLPGMGMREDGVETKTPGGIILP